MSVPVEAARLAVGTLTVLPITPPREVDRRVAGLAMALAAVAVLPLAAAVALVVWLGDGVQAPPLLTAVLAVAALALGSGGLHLDGLADTADGLAVPGDVGRRLEVMRTGAVGPVGAVALVVVLLVQVASLAGTLDRHGTVAAAVTSGLAVVVSRGCLAPACARGVAAARDDGLGRTVAGAVPVSVTLIVLAGLATLAGLVHGGRGVAGVVVALAATALGLLQARRRLGGITGDVLGAVVEVALAGYLVAQVVDPSALPGG